MSDFAFVPSTQTRGQDNPRVLESRYGEGYRQMMGDGPNAIQQTWTLVFLNRDPSYIASIRTFLKGKFGYVAFTWTPLAPFNSEIKVICKTWPWTYDAGGGIIALQCEFEEVAVP